MKKIIKKYVVGDFIVEIDVHESQNLEGAKANNVELFDNLHNRIWEIKDLLTKYSNRNNLTYFDELYFDIYLIDDSTFRLIGFNNHCEVSTKSMSIIKLINNR